MMDGNSLTGALTDVEGLLLNQDAKSSCVYTIIEDLKSCSELLVQQVKQTRIELYIRALTKDFNRLDVLLNENVAAVTSKELATGLLKLADELSDHLSVSRECVLTAFCLDPTKVIFDKIDILAARSGLNAIDTEQWECKFHAPVKPSEVTVQCKNCNKHMQSTNLYIFNTNTILSEALTDANLELPQELWDELSIILCSPRYRVFSWLQEWNALHRFCLMYLDNPDQIKKILTDLVENYTTWNREILEGNVKNLKNFVVEYVMFPSLEPHFEKNVEILDLTTKYTPASEKKIQFEDMNIMFDSPLLTTSDTVPDIIVQDQPTAEVDVFRAIQHEAKETEPKVKIINCQILPPIPIGRISWRNAIVNTPPSQIIIQRLDNNKLSLSSVSQRSIRDPVAVPSTPADLLTTESSLTTSSELRTAELNTIKQKTLEVESLEVNNKMAISQTSVPGLDATVELIAESPMETIAETVPHSLVSSIEKMQLITIPVASTIIEPTTSAMIQQTMATNAAITLSQIGEPIMIDPEVETFTDPVIVAVVDPHAKIISEPVIELVLEPIAEADADTIIERSRGPIVEAVIEELLSRNTKSTVEIPVEPNVGKITEIIADTAVEAVVNTILINSVNRAAFATLESNVGMPRKSILEDVTQITKENIDVATIEEVIGQKITKKQNLSSPRNKPRHDSHFERLLSESRFKPYHKPTKFRKIQSKLIGRNKIMQNISNEYDGEKCNETPSNMLKSDNYHSGKKYLLHRDDDRKEQTRKSILEDVTQITKENIDVATIEEVIGQKIPKKQNLSSPRNKPRHDSHFQRFLSESRFKPYYKPTKFRKIQSKLIGRNKIMQNISNEYDGEKRNETPSNMLKSDNYHSGKKYLLHRDGDRKEQTRKSILEDVTQITKENIDVATIEEVIGQKITKKQNLSSPRNKPRHDSHLERLLSESRFKPYYKPTKFRKIQSKLIGRNKIMQNISNEYDGEKRNETPSNMLKSDNYHSGKKYLLHRDGDRKEQTRKYILEDVTQITKENIDVATIEEVIGQKITKKQNLSSPRNKPRHDSHLERLLSESRFKPYYKPTKFRKIQSKLIGRNKIMQNISNEYDGEKRNETPSNMLKSDNYHSGKKYILHRDGDRKEQTNHQKNLFHGKGTEGLYTEETVLETEKIRVSTNVFVQLLRGINVVIDRINLPDRKRRFTLSDDPEIFAMCDQKNKKLPRTHFRGNNHVS